MAASAQVNLSYPKVRSSLEKFVKIVKSDTAAFQATVLPKDSIITGVYVLGALEAAAANTTATINVGTTTSANEILSTYDVKSTTLGVGYNPGGAAVKGAIWNSKLTVDTPIYAKFIVDGANATGGPWYVKLEYSVVGGGEDIQM